MYPMTGDIGVDLYKGWTPRRQFYKPSPHRFTRIRSRDNTSFIIYIYDFFFFFILTITTLPLQNPIISTYCTSCVYTVEAASRLQHRAHIILYDDRRVIEFYVLLLLFFFFTKDLTGYLLTEEINYSVHVF